MKISLNWLKEYIDIEDNPDKLGEILTQTGLEVEGIESFNPIEGGLEKVVIGKVMSCQKHPDADKLNLTTVDVGAEELLQIVCGAPNVAVGQQVIVALVGSTLYPTNGEPFKIKKAKIRGQASFGMICAEDEIGIGHEHDGIMVVETSLPNGAPAADYFDIVPDNIIEIGLTPNRADAISHLGVARDLKAVYKHPVRWPNVDDFSIDNTSVPIDITIENEEACPRYAGVMLTGLSVVPSPDWLQTKLKSIGLKPINAIVDITNFVCHEMGQPLHAFDADQIHGNKIIVKTLPAGSKFVTLDEKERTLLENDLMICDEKGGMCIAGVFGGIKSGVTDETKSIFLEGAYFSADYVRKTSMAHGLKTDASFRYERGTDPRLPVYAIKRAAMLIKDLCGGEISSDIFDHYPNPVEDFKVKVSYKHVKRLIGKEIGQDRIAEILESLDISMEEKSEDGFVAIVPPYRVDVSREADVIEEILRIYGFNNVEIPDHYGADFLSDFPVIDKERMQFRTSEMLCSMGFNEIMTNSLTKISHDERLSFIKAENGVKIVNKLSEDLGVLRQDLALTALESVAYNLNRKQKNLKMFEFGKAYSKSADGYKEVSKLLVMMVGNFEDENWINKARQLEFHDLSSVVNKILNKFNILNVTSAPIHDGLFASGLKISNNGKEIVAYGKLSRELLKHMEIEEDVWHAWFDWDYLLKQSGKTINYTAISKFPEVRRDLSLVLDKQVTFDQIKDIAEKNDNRLLRSINVFDVYEGDSVGENKKAYAVKFILQDQHKTLNEKTIDKTMDRLMQSFEKELGAIIRK